MSKNPHTIKSKPFNLTYPEMIEADDYYREGGNYARTRIWQLVENNEPIDNALKPFLLKLLEKNCKGKSKEGTRRYWRELAWEVAHYVLDNPDVLDNPELDSDIKLTITKAIEVVAAEHHEEIETLRAKYYKPEHAHIRRLLSSIKN